MKTPQVMRALTPCLFEPLESRQLMSAGDPDLSFGVNGQTTVSFPGEPDFHVNDVAVQRDGKIVVAGQIRGLFAVARLNFDGTPDPTFAFNGLFKDIVGENSVGSASAVAIQGDGKIVAAGQATDMPRSVLGVSLGFSHPEFTVVRYLPDGQRDRTFSGDGEATIDFDGGAKDIAIQGDGKIVVVGENHDSGRLGFGGDKNFAVARLRANGSLDKSFGDSGKKQIGFGGDDFAEAVTLAPGGKIIVVGRTGSESSSAKMAIARLNADGKRDGTFGPSGDGQLTVSFPGNFVASGRDVIMQSDKIVVVGTTGNPKNPNSMQFALARVLPDGQMDASFGQSGAGVVVTDLGGNDVAMGVIRSSDGGLMVAGSSNKHYALASYTADGAPNNTFGNGGTIVTGLGDVDTTQGMGMAKGLAMRRFVVAGGKDLTTARFLDTGANVVSVASVDSDAREFKNNPASLLVTRTERLPVPTRVFFSITGTAQGPLAPADEIDYDLTGVGVELNPPGSAVPFTNFVDIPAGETFITATLTPRNDGRTESAETAIFTIESHPSYVVGTNPTATVTIANNVLGRFTGVGPIAGTVSIVLAPRSAPRVFSQLRI